MTSSTCVQVTRAFVFKASRMEYVRDLSCGFGVEVIGNCFLKSAIKLSKNPLKSPIANIYLCTTPVFS